MIDQSQRNRQKAHPGVYEAKSADAVQLEVGNNAFLMGGMYALSEEASMKL